MDKLNILLASISSYSNKKNLVIISPLLLVLIGIFAMYVPTFVDLFKGIWSTDQQAHGPIVFAVASWFFYYKASLLSKTEVTLTSAPKWGYPLLLLGCLLYVMGRSQSLYIFEVGSLTVVMLGLVLLFFGTQVARYLWFAFFFMLFMVPLPASIVDIVTQPMKLAVSYGAEHLLYWLDYPVARSGVIIIIAQYRLLVADACAGLNSLFTLEVLGLLYMNVMRHESPLRNATLAILIIPISFASNVTRVLILALITYYYGDAAGQGFVHEFSGMVLFVTALMLIVGVDTLLRLITKVLNKQSSSQVIQKTR